jgi:predicted Zn-dependent peptidase
MRFKFLLILFLTILAGNFIFAENVEKTVFPNGLVILTKENHASKIVAIEIFIKNIFSSEYRKKAGITNFLQNLLLKGTKKRTQEKLAEDIDSLGGKIDFSISNDYTSLNLIISSQFLKDGLEILTDVLLNPKFDDEEIEKTRKEIIQEIRKEEDELFIKVYREFLKTLYKDHPYGTPEIGDEESIKNITREEILEFYKNFYVPNNMIISAVGDFNKEELIKELEKYFSQLPPKEIPIAKFSEEINLDSPRESIIEKDTASYWAILGFPASGIKNKKEYVTLKVLDSIIGSGMSSLLFTNLRDKLGIAYEISSFYPTRKYTSHFAVYAITSQNISKIKSAFLFEISKLKYINFTPQELERAKKYLIGNFILEREENKKQAFYLGFYELLGLGYNFEKEYIEMIRKVKLDEIREVARKYFKNYVFVAIGEKKEVEGE